MTRPLRIGFVGTELAPLRPSAGGLERLVTGWATALSRQFATTCISRFDDASPGTRYNTTAPLAQLVEGCDVVVVNNRPAWANEIDLPVVLVLHNTVEAWALPGWDATRHQLTTPTVMGPNVVVAAVSSYLARHVQEQLGLAALPVVLPPFIDPAFADGPRWQPNENSLLFPNRLLTKKGVLETIAAIKRVSDPRATVVFLENFAPWSQPTGEHLTLLEHINACARCRLEPRIEASATLANRMLGAQAVLAPSIHPEGLGLVPLEALALGIPTIISNMGGLGELARYGATVVEPIDDAGFAAAIEESTQKPPAIDVDGVRRDFGLRRSAEILAASLQEATLR